jgi:CRP-like cAMP-binding protein
MKNFRDFLDNYAMISDGDWNDISKEFAPVSYHKDDLILEEGQICRYFYFFEQGLLRFFSNHDGEEITRTFTIPPYCFTSKISFRNQSPANESIQALDDTIVWRLDYLQYKKLEKLESWNLFIRKLIHEVQDFTDQLLFDSKTQTADERYALLQNNYSEDILRKIPLKYLASFLGIAPQSLSRIRNNLKKNP